MMCSEWLLDPWFPVRIDPCPSDLSLICARLSRLPGTFFVQKKTRNRSLESKNRKSNWITQAESKFEDKLVLFQAMPGGTFILPA